MRRQQGSIQPIITTAFVDHGRENGPSHYLSCRSISTVSESSQGRPRLNMDTALEDIQFFRHEAYLTAVPDRTFLKALLKVPWRHYLPRNRYVSVMNPQRETPPRRFIPPVQPRCGGSRHFSVERTNLESRQITLDCGHTAIIFLRSTTILVLSQPLVLALRIRLSSFWTAEAQERQVAVQQGQPILECCK